MGGRNLPVWHRHAGRQEQTAGRATHVPEPRGQAEVLIWALEAGNADLDGISRRESLGSGVGGGVC